MRIAIIGAGPSGIAAGRELKRQGFTDFTLFDTLDAPGGTWRLHSYPGLACDVWAHSYSFSYAPNPDWTASFVEQPEIQAYLAKCTHDFGLDPHLRLNTRIATITWQDSGYWQLVSDQGTTFDADVVINAMGNQHTPLFPQVPGRDRFRGPSWHGTRWDHSVDLAGKRVIIVGSAACAVQIVPEIAKIAGELTVLQRSANWIMPRGRKFYSDARRRWFRRLPLLMKITRKVQALMMGQVEYAATLGHKRMDQFERVALNYLESVIEDPQLRRALTPDSRYGCKRGLVSDDFYPALNRDNVSLVPEGLTEVVEDGVITSSGQKLEADVIIYCTGYRIMDYDRIEVRGSTGQTLAEALGDTPQAYKGLATPGFPNYFFAMGPNALVLNVSYFRTAEQNVATIVRLLSEMRAASIPVVDVALDKCKGYFAWMADRFKRYSWAAPDCQSYYRNSAGYPPFLFPGSFRDYQKQHAEVSLADFDKPATSTEKAAA